MYDCPQGLFIDNNGIVSSPFEILLHNIILLPASLEHPTIIFYASIALVRILSSRNSWDISISMQVRMHSSVFNILGVAITIVATIKGHVKLEDPLPYGAATLDTNPLLTSGSDWPWYDP